MSKIKILMVYDTKYWAFFSQAKGLINNSNNMLINYDMCSMAEFLKKDLSVYDIIFAMGLFGMSNPIYATRLKGLKFVTMVHHNPHNVGFTNDIKVNQYLEQERLFALKAVNHSSISEKTRVAWIEECKLDSHVLPSGIDTKEFIPHEILQDNKKIIIGWCGNPDKPLKGFHDIICPAIEKVKKKMPGKEIVLKFQGFKNLVSHEEMPKFYKDIDLYICASSYEGLPTPLVEASACGIPYVSTDVGIVREMDVKGLNCIINRDIDSLSEGIVSMIKNPERMKSAGKSNREAIMAGWSWDIAAEMWETFILSDTKGLKVLQDKRRNRLEDLTKKDKVVPARFTHHKIDDFQKIVLGEDPWAEKFKDKIKSLPHYKTLVELNCNPNINMEETSYYKWLHKTFIKNGTVWGFINSLEDVEKQYNKYMILIQNPSLGEDAEQKIAAQVKNGITYYYGHYPIRIEKDGSYKLMDGHHRLAIKLFNQEPIELTVCERHGTWKKLLADLETLYGGKRLYQPVDHLDLKDWKSGRDNRIEENLNSIFRKYDIKSVIDLGICHGYTLYKLAHHIDWAVGVEYNKTRAEIASALYTQLGFRVKCDNIVDFMKSNKQKPDCILALAVFHHIAKQNTPGELLDTLVSISRSSKTLIYTMPEPGEPQYVWIPENIRRDVHGYIQRKTGYTQREEISLRSRKLIILSR